MIIWWWFDDDLMMIWWWFDDDLMMIWWLFDDYSWLFDDYLIIIIRDYSMIIRFPLQQQVVWFASFPKAFAWNSGSSWSGWWQPFPWAYRSLRVSPATCCRSYASSATTILSFMAVSTSLQPSRKIWRYPKASSKYSSNWAIRTVTTAVTSQKSSSERYQG